MLFVLMPKFHKMITEAFLAISLCSPLKEESIMRHVRFKYIGPEDYNHFIDLYFKLEMKHVLEKIIFAHTQGSFNITLVSAA